ncbi:MAG: ArnT family glycosyltransferase, partial [Cyclobacteriaceae bacterium]
MYQTFIGYLKTHEVSCYLLLWFTINLSTAASIELYSDEAYYWVFSRFMDWGYLDHPPMIAALIKLGTLIGNTEVGVRIMSILLGTATIWLLYKLCQPIQARFFFATVFSMLSLNLIGFISVPDVPLLFFATAFFYFYREYLRDTSVWSAIKLGLVIAALFYSKYHGVLLIVFTLLSNPKLFGQRNFYLAAVTAILLLLPHILWQIQHDFPSVQYHLLDRGTSSYKINKTIGYLLGNIPFHGPWASVVLIFAALKYSTKDLWERSLKWNLIGIFVFFLFMTTKGYVEANWTLMMVVPFLVLGLRKLMEWKGFQKVYLRVTYIFVALIVMVRLLLIFPIDSLPIKRVLEFHGGEH